MVLMTGDTVARVRDDDFDLPCAHGVEHCRHARPLVKLFARMHVSEDADHFVVVLGAVVSRHSFLRL